MSLHFTILTLFPEMFPGPLGHSLSGKAKEQGLWDVDAVNIRNYADDTHKSVDDTPYGGGAGMVMRADILEKAHLDNVKQHARRIYLSPRGKLLDQTMATELAASENLMLLCGRYEGVDARFLEAYDYKEVSVGDYVLSGGEIPALTLMDACIRLLPGVMGNKETLDEESFTGGLLEYPHYTRPAQWQAQNGKSYNVPDILTSGDHGKIKEWREVQSLEITKKRRPDLL